MTQERFDWVGLTKSDITTLMSICGVVAWKKKPAGGVVLDAMAMSIKLSHVLKKLYPNALIKEPKKGRK